MERCPSPVEGARLEIVWALKRSRGFESHPLRPEPRRVQGLPCTLRGVWLPCTLRGVWLLCTLRGVWLPCTPRGAWHPTLKLRVALSHPIKSVTRSLGEGSQSMLVTDSLTNEVFKNSLIWNT